MQLFKYTFPFIFYTSAPIKDYDSVVWTERYRDPGEFEIVAKLSTGLKDLLPAGSLISHTNTLDVMMVENHQITEDDETDPILSITGRDLGTILEERIIGQSFAWTTSPPASLEAAQYILAADYTWNQAVELINDHVKVGTVTNADDGIASLEAVTDISDSGEQEERTLPRRDVFSQLLEILAIDDLGYRVIRPHMFSDKPYFNTGINAKLLIHNGIDKRETVMFSTKNGDIDSADYLWSIRKMKNAALVTGRFVEQMVYGTEIGHLRRVMHIDGSDLDGHLEEVPTGGALTAIRAAMTTRANAVLRSQRRLSLSRIDISATPTYEYRRDYNIGDIVAVDSSYGPVAPMRVVEYVEIEDENGQSAHPTLEIIEE